MGGAPGVIKTRPATLQQPPPPPPLDSHVQKEKNDKHTSTLMLANANVSHTSTRLPHYVQIQMTAERSFELENLQYLEFFPMPPTWDQSSFQPIGKFKRNIQVLTH